MEPAKIYCEKSQGRFFGEYRVSLHDLHGEEVTGNFKLRGKHLDVKILENHGNKLFVLLPKGMNKETAWINSNYLN